VVKSFFYSLKGPLQNLMAVSRTTSTARTIKARETLFECFIFILKTNLLYTVSQSQKNAIEFIIVD